MGTYQKGYFRGISNIYLNLITCKDNIIIQPILKSYKLHWYHTYLLHPGMDIAEAMIFQHLYWPGISNVVWKEVTYCDTCQCTKRSNKNMVDYQIRKLSKYHGTNYV